ncbi:hypothetical protein ACFE04_021974 [Oxalis oulophora]
MDSRYPRPFLTLDPPLPNNSSQPSDASQQNVETWMFITFIFLAVLAFLDATIDKCLENIHIHLMEDDQEDIPDQESEQVPNSELIIHDLNALTDHSWAVELIERFKELSKERREKRIHAIEEILPLVDSSLGDCAICLESFLDEKSCRVFPVCNHIFHSGCICSWLEDHLTCPICRNKCDLDV